MQKLKVLEKNLTFSQALEALKEHKWVACPEWKGYWFVKGGLIRAMTEDGEINDPWTREQLYLLREDWQIVEVDIEAEQAEIAKMVSEINKQPLQFFNSPQHTDFEPIPNGTPAMETSLNFRHWLSQQEIEWRDIPNGTLIVGSRDMFEIGRAWGTHKALHEKLEQVKKG